MVDADGREPAVGQLLHAFPCGPTALTAVPQRATPPPDQLAAQHVQGAAVHRYTLVAHVPHEHGLQPLPDLRRGSCMRRRSSVFTSRSFACNLVRIVRRYTVNRPLLLVLPQMCVKPRKSKVSGSPVPAAFDFRPQSGRTR